MGPKRGWLGLRTRTRSSTTTAGPALTPRPGPKPARPARGHGTPPQANSTWGEAHMPVEIGDVRLVAQTDDVIGEVPQWDARDKSLYWADILKPAFYRYSPSTGDLK